MRKVLAFAALAACSLASPAFAADTITFNSDPSIAFNYGAGNNYIPANSAVLTTTDPTSQLAGRAHIYQQAALPSDASGVYSFALGSNVSIDYSFSNMLTGSVQLLNLLTGQSAEYSVPFVGSLNNSLFQDSQRLSFGFLNGGSIFGNLGFDASVNDTYQVNLVGTNAGGTHTDTFYVQLGSGAPLPEPATWAMMLLGFAGIGVAVRRQRPAKLPQIA
jgi:opacity protein-like surface antigen